MADAKFVLDSNPTASSAHARYAAFTRDRAPDDPKLVAARAEMQALRWLEQVSKLIAKVPRLTPEQCTYLGRLLSEAGVL